MCATCTSCGYLFKAVFISLQSCGYYLRVSVYLKKYGTCPYIHWRLGIDNNDQIWSLTIFFPRLVAPTILDPPENLTVVQPQSATFLCNATTRPRPEITWWRMGSQLMDQTNGIEISISISGEREVMSNLTIIMADPSDAGGYICMATNPAGQDTAAAELTVYGKELSLILLSYRNLIFDHYCLLQSYLTSPSLWMMVSHTL